MDDLLAEIFDDAGFECDYISDDDWCVDAHCSWLSFNVCSLENQNFFTCDTFKLPVDI